VTAVDSSYLYDLRQFSLSALCLIQIAIRGKIGTSSITTAVLLSATYQDRRFDTIAI